VSKQKLSRFAENQTFTNLFQLSFNELTQKGFPLKGNWNKDFFMKDAPIVLELGCGKGEYTVGLALLNPEKHFIGMDIKGARMWRGLKTASEQNFQNVAFIRSRIEFIEHIFGEKEVDEIWITFPDPQPKHYKARKRLTSPMFLDRYRNILNDQHVIHLKTDDRPLFEYTLKTLAMEHHHVLYQTSDLYGEGLSEPASFIQTFYEKIWLAGNKKICYLRFCLNT
jgi:tRNA (guanine-N7-)-methyltransferase